jgi:hypothetical protein
MLVVVQVVLMLLLLQMVALVVVAMVEKMELILTAPMRLQIQDLVVVVAALQGVMVVLVVQVL